VLDWTFPVSNFSCYPPLTRQRVTSNTTHLPYFFRFWFPFYPSKVSGELSAAPFLGKSIFEFPASVQGIPFALCLSSNPLLSLSSIPLPDLHHAFISRRKFSPFPKELLPLNFFPSRYVFACFDNPPPRDFLGALPKKSLCFLHFGRTFSLGVFLLIGVCLLRAIGYLHLQFCGFL